jgi:hypothetical protein
VAVEVGLVLIIDSPPGVKCFSKVNLRPSS